MAISATKLDSLTTTAGVIEPPGAYYAIEAEISFDTSYPTNGYAITAALFGFSRIRKFLPSALGPSLNATVNDFSYDRANGKVKLYNGGTEVTNATDVSASKLYAYVEGIL